MPDNDKLNEALNSILNNGELMDKIKSVAGDISDNPSNDSESKSALDNTGGNAKPSISPEMMQKLPGIIEALSPILQSGALGGGKGNGNGKEGAKTFKHEQLLKALKPYLNSSRCDSIDKITQITQLTNTLEGALPLIMPKNNDKEQS